MHYRKLLPKSMAFVNSKKQTSAVMVLYETDKIQITSCLAPKNKCQRTPRPKTKTQMIVSPGSCLFQTVPAKRYEWHPNYCSFCTAPSIGLLLIFVFFFGKVMDAVCNFFLSPFVICWIWPVTLPQYLKPLRPTNHFYDSSRAAISFCFNHVVFMFLDALVCSYCSWRRTAGVHFVLCTTSWVKHTQNECAQFLGW